MIRKTRLILTLLLLLAFSLLIQAAPALAAGMFISPSSGGYNTTFTLVADGFKSGELVSFTILSPNNSAISSGTLMANGQGRIQTSARIPSGSPAGRYTVIAQGRSSHHQYSASFTVTTSASPVSNTTTLAPAGMFVTPTSGTYSTTFVLTAGGFNPYEPVSSWVMTPNNAMIGPQTQPADKHGAIQFSGQVPYGYPSGKYTAFARGQYSGHMYSDTFTLVVSTPTSFPHWKGEYFNNRNLSGTPVLVRDDTSVDFGWGLGSPGAAVHDDHFSVRWTRSLYFSTGTYTFTTQTDDGVRLWVGGTRLIDAWYDQSDTHTGTITLSAGTYPVKVEYYENTGYAHAHLSWAATSSYGQQPWTGHYYNNMTLSGSAAFVRQDPSINFDWGGGSPGSGVTGTTWSAKWDSAQYAPHSGNYTISVVSDDGVRVWVDGNLVIDQWHDQSPTFHSVTGYLNAGWHAIHVEYYQHVGGSQIHLQFLATP